MEGIRDIAIIVFSFLGAFVFLLSIVFGILIVRRALRVLGAIDDLVSELRIASSEVIEPFSRFLSFISFIRKLIDTFRKKGG